MKKNLGFLAFSILIVLFFYGKRDSKDRTEILVSIKPIHSLVCAITNGVAEPKLLLDGQFSPHHVRLSPSQVQAIQQAKLFIWIGSAYEEPLVNHIKNLKGKNITIQDSALLKLKPLRSGAFWDKNAGCPHDHEHHHHGEDCNHDHHSSAHEGNLDGHLWLDPLMMIKVIDVLLPELKIMYPEQAKLLEKNARAYRKTLEDLYKKLQAHLALNKGLTYIIQHDGNQYFDTAFGVHTIATISIDPSIPPSAGHMLKIKKAITNGEIHPKCLFAERQIDGKLAKSYAETLNINFATLDYLGTDIPAGENAYEELMLEYVTAFVKGIGAK